MAEIKIKYFGLSLNKKNYLRLYFFYLGLNIILFTYFSIFPISTDLLSNFKFVARNLHFLLLGNLVYTVIEGQFFWNKFTKGQLETIMKLKIELEEKNNDILSSIRYAKRIQTSLLPTDKYLDRVLRDKDKCTGA